MKKTNQKKTNQNSVVSERTRMLDEPQGSTSGKSATCKSNLQEEGSSCSLSLQELDVRSYMKSLGYFHIPCQRDGCDCLGFFGYVSMDGLNFGQAAKFYLDRERASIEAQLYTLRLIKSSIENCPNAKELHYHMRGFGNWIADLERDLKKMEDSYENA